MHTACPGAWLDLAVSKLRKLDECGALLHMYGALQQNAQAHYAGYLHEALITRRGIPAVLAVLYAEVMQRLLARRAVAFAVRIDCHHLDECAAQLPT